jgi:hypothetical protein
MTLNLRQVVGLTVETHEVVGLILCGGYAFHPSFIHPLVLDESPQM